MGHVREMKEIDGELRPVIVFDMLLRMKPMPGREIILGDVRQIIYRLRDELGFRIKKVTLDGFQSQDTMQQLQKRKFDADYLSVDRNLLPYQDLRDAIYEERIEFPRYMSYWKHGDAKPIEIAYKELTELVDTGKKVDHPEGGSKDVADTMAGVCSVLAGDRQFQRGVGNSEPSSNRTTDPNGYDPTAPQKQKNVQPGFSMPPSLAPVNAPGSGQIAQGGIYDGLDLKWR
jgi:hypothetical protein